MRHSKSLEQQHLSRACITLTKASGVDLTRQTSKANGTRQGIHDECASVRGWSASSCNYHNCSGLARYREELITNCQELGRFVIFRMNSLLSI